jgi:hypothetical protein
MNCATALPSKSSGLPSNTINSVSYVQSYVGSTTNQTYSYSTGYAQFFEPALPRTTTCVLQECYLKEQGCATTFPDNSISLTSYSRESPNLTPFALWEGGCANHAAVINTAAVSSSTVGTCGVLCIA